MNILDEIGATTFEMQKLSSRAIKLDAPITFNENEFDHSLVRSNVDSVHDKGMVSRDLFFDYSIRFLLQQVDWHPVLLVGRSTLIRLCQNHPSAMLLPAEQETCNSYYKEEHEEQRPCRPVDLSRVSE